MAAEEVKEDVKLPHTFVNNNQKVTLPKRFHVDEVAEWTSFFHEYGYVVIKDVASSDEVAQAVSGFWNHLESLGSGIDRSESNTWVDQNWPGLLRAGFLGTFGVSHAQFCWDLRSLPAVKKAFAEIWNTDNLITSFSSILCWRQWWLNEDNHDNFRSPKTEGLHIDQSPIAKPGFHCMQGMLILVDVDPKVGGLEIIPGSHKLQLEFAKKYKTKHDWVVISKKDPIQTYGELICAKAGDLLLWDSRTVHGGCTMKGYENGSTEFSSCIARLAMTVCMVPRSRATNKNIEKRRRIFQRGITTNHWPAEASYRYMPNTDGRNIKNWSYSPITLTEEQENLLGRIDMDELITS